MEKDIRKLKDELDTKKRLVIKVRAQPSSPVTEIREIMSDNTLKISIAAPPVGGLANRELVHFLAQQFLVPIDNVKILKGWKNRDKLVVIVV